MSRLLAVRAALLLAVLHAGFTPWCQAQVTWDIDNTTNIGGNAVTVVGNPTVVETPFGSGLAFDGNDGIIVNANPIAGAPNFTMEMIFRPDPIVNSSSNQPRIFHVQSFPTPPDHRAILEGRITGDNQNWYPDAFLLTQPTVPGNPNSLALIDDSKIHPLGKWYHYAMTYDGAHLNAYIDGEEVLSGAIALQAMADGQTSLGMRHNVRNYFEGVIAKVRFSTTALDPSEFLSALIPGDFDRNGTVDEEDYNTWRAEFGATATPPGTGADGNSDGLVDAADYVLWRINAQDGSGSDASPVEPLPEPAALVIFVSGCLGLAPYALRRNRVPSSDRSRVIH